MPSSLPQILRITKALADEHRVRILMLLRRGELCVCQITELMDLAPSTVSKHLSILHAADLVASRKDGRWAYYRLAGTQPEGRRQRPAALQGAESTTALEGCGPPHPARRQGPTALQGGRTSVVEATLGWLESALHGDRSLAADRKGLDRILKVDPSILCQKQRTR